MVAIITDFIPAGRKNRPSKVNPMTYITIHNTGNSSKGAGAGNHAAYIKGDAAANAQVSWHFTVDDKEIIQHLPVNESAYHAGDGGNGTGNTQSIGIEICMNSDGDLLKATDNAAELAAYLCKNYKIDVSRVVQHNKWTGKDCPQMIRAGKPYNWNTFINKVKKLLDAPAKETDKPSAWAKDAWDWAKANGITDGTNPQEPCTREMVVTMMHRAMTGGK